MKVGPSLKVAGEIIAARVMPGVVHVVTLVIVGRSLSFDQYGEFSVVIATIGLVVTVLIGPIEQAIVPLYAQFKVRDCVKDFEGQLLGGVAVLVGLGVVILGVAVVFKLAYEAWLLLFVSMALFRALQPILRARLSFWRYGFVAICQAFFSLFAVLFLVESNSSSVVAVTAYSAGYLVGAVVAWLMVGIPVPRLPARTFFLPVLNVGGALTISSLAESLLLLGTRYAILFFGSPQFLGVFSFAVDLAQRTVGVVINISSFAIVPRAYSSAAKGDVERFRALLVRGAIGALMVSSCVVLGVVLASRIDFVVEYMGGLYSGACFAAASIAVVVNRTKKLALDPFLIQRRCARAIPLAYLIAGPFALLAVSLAVANGYEFLVLFVYPLAYILVAVITLFVLVGLFKGARRL